MTDFEDNSEGAIAIIGMTGRFPGAKDLDEFWDNLYNGVESVKFFNREELLKMGVEEHLLDNPKFVAADAILDGMDEFDATFFDYSAREAEIMDPQHRLFLESAWEVLESAGYNSEQYDGRTAVYGSANMSGYMVRNLYSNPGLIDTVGTFKIMLANGQDFLATKVSYKMNLVGPSINVNTLCSSSLVALHYACQNLQNYGCDIALAGGVSFQVSRSDSFFYQEGGIGSYDGHCNAFDSRASGTVSGSGLAIVVLKRLEDAIADGDYIHAVVRGTGINNDGSHKNSYTAPNVDGQAECIAEAIAISGIDPETITYIDAHGTGTDLGDPIEIAALTKAFRAYTKKNQFCAIGSVKTNIGHLVNAGGMASLIKAVLAMQHKTIPASLNFKEPNPKIDFVNSPLYVNSKLAKWETEGVPLRAGVSSFGIGGTNTHVILEEAPKIEKSQESIRSSQIIMLSAKGSVELEKMTENLLNYGKKNPDANIADIAFTMHVGRRQFNHKRFIICSSINDMKDKIESMSAQYVESHFQKPKEQPVVFMFPGDGEIAGVGSQLINMEPVFAKNFSKCAKVLMPLLGLDIEKTIYPKDGNSISAATQVIDKMTARAVLFSIEYSLAKLWISWGIKPEYMIGEGIGEYVAACIADSLSLEDALKLTVTRDEDIIGGVSAIKAQKPQIPLISSVTGDWITNEDAENAQYWIRQRSGFKVSQGLQEIMKDSNQIVIEIGPANKLTKEAIQYRENSEQTVVSCFELENDITEYESLLLTVGKVWLAGANYNWNKFYAFEKRHRIPLPTYPFQRQKYWIEPGKKNSLQPDIYINSKQDISKDITETNYTEGIFTLKIDMDSNSDSPEARKEKLEKLLLLKEKLESLSKEFSSAIPNIEVSPLGLKTDEINAKFSKGNEGLKKRPRPELEEEYVAPRNEIEEAIAEKWQEVLGYDQIGVNDDFFELGGHSLIAAAVATEMSKKFDVQIPMRTLFETTTIAGIAQLIETYKWAADGEKNGMDSEEIESGEL